LVNVTDGSDELFEYPHRLYKYIEYATIL